MKHDDPHRKPGHAVELEECPYRMCQCGRCGVCGYQKHTAIHGPYADPARGDEPFDHAFMVPENSTSLTPTPDGGKPNGI